MPMYSYVCREGHRKTVLRKVAERDDLVYCLELHVDPEVDATIMQRAWSAPPALHFKGKGVTRGSEAYGATSGSVEHGVGGPADPATS